MKACFLPSILAECLCSIELVVSVGMGAGSEIGAEQKDQDVRRFREMCYPVRNGDCHSHIPAQEAEERPSGAGVAASSRRFSHVRAAGVSSFQIQSIGEGSREAQCPHRPPRAVLPTAGCEHATWAHVLCCGVGENDTVTTLAPPLLSHRARGTARKWRLCCSQGRSWVLRGPQ